MRLSPRLLPHLCLSVAAAMVVSLALGSAAGQSAAQERRLALAGAPNFRDIGGYRTSDGHHVRSGRVYRSGQLDQLTADDYARLARLGISAVCDFRTEGERRAAQTVWQSPGPPEMVALPAPAAGTTPAGNPLAPGATAESVRAFMRRSYAEMVVGHAPLFRVTLRRILADQGAVLYHCSAGKDRTGVFTALLLTMLGVPRDTVMADYLLSNEFLLVSPGAFAVPGQAGADPDAVRAIRGVDRTFLESAFAAIAHGYPSFDDYRRTALGVSDDDVARLKRLLLEP